MKEDQANVIFKIRIHIPQTAVGASIRMNLRHTETSATETQITKSATPTILGQWQEYTFDFSSTTFKHTSHNRALIFLMSTGDTSGDLTHKYYFDALQRPMLTPPSLSINDNSISKTDLTISPTLVDNVFTVNKDITSATIYNLTRQKIQTYGAQKNFNVSHLSSGVYIFNVQLKNGPSHVMHFF